MARRKRRRSAVGRVRRRRRRRSVSANPVRRRRRRRIYAANPRRRRRRSARRRARSYRRNPSFSGGGVVRQAVQGFKDAFVVTLGSGLTNLAASKVPFAQNTAIGRYATQALVGLGGAMLVRKVTKSERAAAFYLAGAFSNIVRPVVSQVPVLGPALGVGSYYRALPSGNGMGSYFRANQNAALNGWPSSTDAPAIERATDDADEYGIA